MPIKRKSLSQNKIQKNEFGPRKNKRRRMNNQEPLSYFFEDLVFPAITFPAEASAEKANIDIKISISPNKIFSLHLNNLI